MRYRFILLMLLLLIINTAVAQWHYVITSQSFNSDCNNWGASLYVLAYEQAVEQWAIKTYSSQEECETARSNHAIINYSSGGCYARVTSTPCQGNASGGSGGASGLYYGEPSLYNSNAASGFVFSPTEGEINQNMVEELLMKMQAFNKNYNNARNFNPNKMSAKTGDDDFDNKYAEEVRRLINKFSKEENTTNNYNFISRKEIDWSNATPNIGDRVTLDGYEVFDSDGPMVKIDSEKLRLLSRDRYYEEAKAKYDSIMGGKNVRKANDNNMFAKVGDAALDITVKSFNVTQIGNEELGVVNELLEMYGLNPIAGDASEKLQTFTDAMSDGFEFGGLLLDGDFKGVAKKVVDISADKLLTPTTDYIQEASTAFTGAFNTIKRVFTVGTTVKESVIGTWEKTKQMINDGVNGVSPNYIYREGAKQQIKVTKDTRSTIFKLIK